MFKLKLNTPQSLSNENKDMYYIYFNTYFIANGRIKLKSSFQDLVLQLNKNEPTETFPKKYLADAEEFLNKAESCRKLELIHA